MPDMTTISAALGSIKTATEIAKLLKNTGKSLEKAEVKLQIAELISSLADVKMEVASIQSEIIGKDKIITELEAIIKTKNSLKWEPPYYWVVNGDIKEGPYCQQCYDNENKLIRLQSNSSNGSWKCQTCKNFVTDSTFVPYKSNRSKGEW